MGAAAASLAAPALAYGATDAWAGAAAIERRARPPVFPSRVFNIVAAGAVADDVDQTTAAFARAIQQCAEAGGGRVLVPPGRWLTGAIRLRTGVELHLAQGATLVFSTDPARYPIVATRWEGVELMNYSPLIFADGERDVAITGRGVLDGQGAAWWSWSSAPRFGWRPGLPNQREARNALFRMAEQGVPVARRVFGDGHSLRPMMLQFQNCANVLVEGVTLRDSPCWTIHPVLSRNVIVRDVTVIGHGPNTDGCDPESVDGMLIERCTFDTGDDCIAIKSGRNADGRRLARPTRNILIQDCLMKDGHGGVVIGSEVSGGVRDIFIRRCRMDSPNLWYALRFKNNAMRGGVVENIHCRDVQVGRLARAAITCDFNYEEGARGAFTPVLRNLTVERMSAQATVQVLDSQGLPTAPVRDIVLRDCQFDGVTQPSIITHTMGLRLERVRVNGKPVAAL
ncbi:MAG: glycoside hydrolase family 28 protein [Caulobacter sp.]|nr:glycoside hydrolase family 28 protein [Caulobacter sp.]